MHGIACDQKFQTISFLAFISDVRRILHAEVLQKGSAGFSILAINKAGTHGMPWTPEGEGNL